MEGRIDYGEAFVVVGAGAAGMATAISVARQGMKVYLFEKFTHLGGTVAHSLIHTIGGLYDSSGEFMNDGLPIELANRLSKASSLTRMRKIGRTWTLSVFPDVYQGVVEAWIGEESKIEVICKSEITRIETDKGVVQKIESVTPKGTITLKPTVLFDTTGSAEIVRMIDPGLVIDSPRRGAGGLIFQMRGVEPKTMKFPNSVGLVRTIHRAAQNGFLPPQCAMAWVDTGLHEDEVYVKLFVPLSANWHEPETLAEITRNAERTRDELVAFLTGLPGFSEAKVTRTGQLGIRDGGQIRGEYCLTEEDVRSGRKFPDPACRSSWPIEFWDPETGVSLEYLPDGDFYEIPLRSLKLKKIYNLWAGGKCLSAESRAQASARIAGCCWAMGEAMGRAAVAQQENEVC